MKIGFFGNVNCMPFRYARELKRMGHDVIFIIDKKKIHKLHRPEYRFDEITYPYPTWIYEFIPPKPELTSAFPNIFFKQIINLLNTCDVVFLNDYGHGLKPFLHKEIPSISLFSGADLDRNARLDLLSDRAKIKKKYLKIFEYLKKYLLKKSINNTRQGIQEAFIVEYFPRGIVPEADSLLDEIKNNKIYERHELRAINSDDVPYKRLVKKDKIMIFNPTRFVWKEPLAEGIQTWSNKRNDIMIKGIGLFYKKHKMELDIHFVEKGPDVKESKKLCDKVDISHMITWHKEMTQKDIFHFYEQCDIGFDQLGIHWVGFGGIDMMLTGRPIIANGRPAVFTRVCGKPLPLCQAETVEEVAQWLEKLIYTEGLIEKKGKEGREYILEHYDIERACSYFIDKIEQYKVNYA